MKSWSSGEIQAALKKSQVLGTVLYMAAHPDDENTRFISYAARGMGLRTGYLSLTRGDGGQNLIGKEVSELLGIIRTQELQMARSTDGGQQFFSRANDFGFSKHPDETLTIWNKNQVLEDAVWVIRKFRPDVIVTRFSPNRPGKTHGHHTTSAMIAVEAAEAAADPTKFPEQLKHVETWKVTRVAWNTSSWFFRSSGVEFDPDKYMKLDVGTYSPLLGASYNEIASRSRSMHKSQGFGSRLQRGGQVEYFQHLLGDSSTNGELFQHVDLTWQRIEGGKKVGKMLADIEKNFSPSAPEQSLEALANVLTTLRAMPQTNYVRLKSAEIEQIMLQCAGIWWEALSPEYVSTAGDSVAITIEAISRAHSTTKLKSIQINGGTAITTSLDFKENQIQKHTLSFLIPSDQPISQPYWLSQPKTKGMFRVDNQLLIGKPENDYNIPVVATFELAGVDITLTTPVQYKWTDPVAGERYRPLTIAPAITANLDQGSLLFADDKEQTINIRLKAFKADISGELSLELPEGWTVHPFSATFNLENKGEEASVPFRILPPENQSVGKLKVTMKTTNQTYNRSVLVIDYPHIPTQTLYPVATANVVKLDIQKTAIQVGYIMGAGDAIPEALRQIGYQVDVLSEDDINLDNLKKYNTIIAGVRAYNTIERMGFHHDVLMQYVEQGGNYIVQYNTSFRLKSDEVGPYPLKLSRDRVTVEEAPITLLEPEHALLNTPNKITMKDFENWVQERGLYFPNEWDEKYTPILACNDPGEPSRKGGLLVAHYGKGSFIYTGYSWFRELPAGVPGAYRIFVNLISYQPEDTNTKADGK